jgi:subtilisin family serine protease
MSEAKSVSAAFEAGLSAADLSLSLDVLGYAESSVSGVISVTGVGNSSVEFSIETQGQYGAATINSITGAVTYTVIGSPTVIATSDQVVVKVTVGTATTTALVNVSLRHDPLFAYQWHLRNVGQSTFADVSPTPRVDINVESAWAAGYSGNGVKVAVVDSGLEIAHEDLIGNIDVGKSINFATDGTDPTNLTPAASEYGDPGTKVAGIIAAQAFNGKGGRGIAHRSRLRSYNLAKYDALQFFSRAFGMDPRSEDTDIFVGSYGSGGQLMPSLNSSKSIVLNATTSLRSGKGAVVVFAAGDNFENNSSAFSPNSCGNIATRIPVSCGLPAADDFKQSIVPIIVGALAADGKKASYSNAASSVWVTAPGGEFGYQASVAGSALTANAYKPAIVTSNTRGCANYSGSRNTLDRAGANPLAANCQYTASMNGTSAAAAMVGGIAALMLEANPNLGYRDVAHILAKTAKKVDPTFNGVSTTLANASRNLEPGWITNAAGYNFSNRYGFGAVDAGAAVAMAKTYSEFLPPQTLVSATPVRFTTDRNIGVSGKVVNFAISSNLSKTEKVFVKVNFFMREFGSTGTSCNQIELTSPAGTRSVLLNARGGFTNTSLTNVVLSSNAFYGENPNGAWKMTIYDWCGESFLMNTQFSNTASQEFSLAGH